MKPDFSNSSDAFKKRNPHLFGPVRALQADQSKPVVAKTLERRDQQQPEGKKCVGICIEFIACLRRRLDDDNFSGSLKPLRDAIAETIGIDDGDRRLQWRYHQIPTNGTEGVIVRIEPIYTRKA